MKVSENLSTDCNQNWKILVLIQSDPKLKSGKFVRVYDVENTIKDWCCTDILKMVRRQGYHIC